MPLLTKAEFASNFADTFGMIEDHREANKISYLLEEILFVTIVGIASNATSWEEIEDFGKAHLFEFREYFEFKNGIPSDDTIRRFFRFCNPASLNSVLMKYFKLSDQNENDQKIHIAFDGKRLLGSKTSEEKALHLLNAYVTEKSITFYSKKVDNKTNEISGFAEALDLLDMKGAIISGDAILCQRELAKKVILKGADYFFGLKGNQGYLYNEVKSKFSASRKMKTLFCISIILWLLRLKDFYFFLPGV
jgi:hypothetical protein